jgi:hypothetical protein
MAAKQPMRTWYTPDFMFFDDVEREEKKLRIQRDKDVLWPLTLPDIKAQNELPLD